MHRYDFQPRELYVAPSRFSLDLPLCDLTIFSPRRQVEDALHLSGAALLERTARPSPTLTPSPALPVDASSTLAHQDSSRRPTPRSASRLPGSVRRGLRFRVEADASKTRLFRILSPASFSKRPHAPPVPFCALERAPRASQTRTLSRHTYPLFLIRPSPTLYHPTPLFSPFEPSWIIMLLLNHGTFANLHDDLAQTLLFKPEPHLWIISAKHRSSDSCARPASHFVRPARNRSHSAPLD